MTIIAAVLTALVGLFHAGFLVIEMFFWNHPFGQRSFGLTPEFAAASQVLAANQGLYNGFLAAGLFWAGWSRRIDLAVFFLGCVIVAGLYGAATAKTSILLVQALPAAIALAAVLFIRPKAT